MALAESRHHPSAFRSIHDVAFSYAFGRFQACHEAAFFVKFFRSYLATLVQRATVFTSKLDPPSYNLIFAANPVVFLHIFPVEKTEMDIEEVLKRLNLLQYVELLREAEIDGEALQYLTAKDLRELGIDPRHAQKLLTFSRHKKHNTFLENVTILGPDEHVEMRGEVSSFSFSWKVLRCVCSAHCTRRTEHSALQSERDCA